jgi:hypothetical protein
MSIVNGAMDIVRAAAATYIPTVPLHAFTNAANVRFPAGKAAYARYAKPEEDSRAAVGKT